MADDPNTKKEDMKTKNMHLKDYTLRAIKADTTLMNTGITGITGYSGLLTGAEITGISGTSGITGISGTSGITGISGLLSGAGMSEFSFDSKNIFYKPSLDQETILKTHKLEETIANLRREASDLAKEVQLAKASDEEKAKTIEQFREKYRLLAKNEQLSFLLRGVNEKAKKLLLESDEFQKCFLENPQCDAFVMSVDIRRSTELMSKARSPQRFADFMTTLCKELEVVIKENYGVFDKFTGDGVLAFFPSFYSGEDAGFCVVSVADRCHKIFEDKYREFRSSFISVLTEVGLGIGIDYGTSHLVQVAGGLTVVGAPVVYACRMSGAPAGTTLLNQPGYEKISEKFSSYCFFQETEIEIKNEGKMLAYKVKLNGKEYSPSPPNWPMQEPKVSEKEAQPNN